MNLTKGKYRALLGGLIVFVIPFLVVSAIFWSKKPNVYVLPVVQENILPQTALYTVESDTISLEELHQDIKILFFTDSSTFQNRKQAVFPLYTETRDYPKKTFKEPYPEVYFLNVVSDVSTTDHTEQQAWFNLPKKINPQLSVQELNTELLYLFDQKNNLRGEYEFSAESIAQLKKDLQNLMAQVYNQNSKAKRRDRL